MRVGLGKLSVAALTVRAVYTGAMAALFVGVPVAIVVRLAFGGVTSLPLVVSFAVGVLVVLARADAVTVHVTADEIGFGRLCRPARRVRRTDIGLFAFSQDDSVISFSVYAGDGRTVLYRARNPDVGSPKLTRIAEAVATEVAWESRKSFDVKPDLRGRGVDLVAAVSSAVDLRVDAQVEFWRDGEFLCEEHLQARDVTSGGLVLVEWQLDWPVSCNRVTLVTRSRRAGHRIVAAGLHV